MLVFINLQVKTIVQMGSIFEEHRIINQPRFMQNRSYKRLHDSDLVRNILKTVFIEHQVSDIRHIKSSVAAKPICLRSKLNTGLCNLIKGVAMRTTIHEIGVQSSINFPC